MKKVGVIEQKVIEILGLNIKYDTSIFLGETNINHMNASHPEEYAIYGLRIPDIIANPTYVGINPKDSSIEYIKEYELDGIHLKVAVRVSTRDIYFVRSIYLINGHKIENFIRKGRLFLCK